MKVELGARNCLYPMPTVIVGAMVNGRPNYITVAHVGIMDFGSISVSLNRTHHTNAGIRDNRTFSVNLPTESMVTEADYCGLVSGRDVDKSALFVHFFGKLGTAPMIQRCPLNMECRLTNTLDFPRHEVFVGEIVATYCDDNCVEDAAVDIGRLRPLLFDMSRKGYWRLGEHLARAWSVGKGYQVPS